jgi:hypothetical protein
MGELAAATVAVNTIPGLLEPARNLYDIRQTD